MRKTRKVQEQFEESKTFDEDPMRIVEELQNH